MRWPIDQRALHGRDLQLRDQRLKRASLFPLFDREGKTQALMLVSEESPHILLVEWRQDIFVRRLFRTCHLNVSRADLRDSEHTEARELAHLWHFDPWWVLGEHRYADHPAVPPLKATNLPGFDTALDRVTFDARLSRVAWVSMGPEDSWRRFRPKLLSTAESERAKQANHRSADEVPRSRWRLRPFWG